MLYQVALSQRSFLSPHKLLYESRALLSCILHWQCNLTLQMVWLILDMACCTMGPLQNKVYDLPIPALQVWVTVAAKLNWDIVQLNTSGKQL